MGINNMTAKVKKSYQIYVELIGWCYGSYHHSQYISSARYLNDPHIIFRHAISDRIGYKKVSPRKSLREPNLRQPFTTIGLELVKRLEMDDRFLVIDVVGREWISIASNNMKEKKWQEKGRKNFDEVIAPMRSHWKRGPYKGMGDSEHSGERKLKPTVRPIPLSQIVPNLPEKLRNIYIFSDD